MEDDDLLVHLSALEHWSFCRRQCGLIHLEGLWAENVRTVEGKQLHEKVDLPGLEQRPGLRLARALSLKSERHRLIGKADLVAFYDDPAYPITGRPFPVEYKRSARNKFRHAELQLCAQALCLEEMLGVTVPVGALYFGASRRRREVGVEQREGGVGRVGRPGETGVVNVERGRVRGDAVDAAGVGHGRVGSRGVEDQVRPDRLEADARQLDAARHQRAVLERLEREPGRQTRGGQAAAGGAGEQAGEEAVHVEGPP